MTQAVAGQTEQAKVYEVRTTCRLCLNRCGILATVQSGNVIRIDGDPANPYNQGKACAKGRAGFVTLTSPHRVTQPLRRTNPEKGPGVDPGWQPLGWDEALDLVAEKLKQLRQEDARKLWHVSFDFSLVESPWAVGFGTVVQPFSSGFFCGNAVHPPHFLNQFAMEAVPDMPLTRYILSVGGQFGVPVHYDTMNGTYELGRNREKVKVVAVDPFCTHAAAMADEWVPIRPGTDAAFILALVNLLINELGVYDVPFLKHLTNAPYLIGGDGRYVRDAASGKPLLWDATEGAAKPFDAGTADPALLGVYRVRGEEVRPAFQVIADQARRYSPEEAAQITTVPAGTIRRLAREFGEAACIGQTINIGGDLLSYRPVAVSWYRGLSSHKHAHLNGFAAMLLQTIVGGLDVPGGLMGYSRAAYRATEDGLLTIAARPGRGGPTSPYPPRAVAPPQSIDLFELFPAACYSRPFAAKAIADPAKYHNLPTQPKVLLQRRSNMAYTGAGKEMMTEVFRRIPFIVSIDTEIEETAEFADVVLPALHYLEELEIGGLVGGFNYHTGSHPETFFGAKPAARPPFEPPWDQLVSDSEILLALAERAGFLDDVYAACNVMWGLPPTLALEPGKHYSYQELVDRYLKATLGPDKGLEWYMADGLLVKERSPKERYPGAYPKPRIHVYHEYMLEAGRQVEAVTRELDIPWETSDYIPLAEWRPCPAYTHQAPGYDLYLVTAKAPYHALTSTGGNPFLQEVGDRLGYEEIVVHRETARKKGLRNGDWVQVETDSGKRGQAQVKLTAGVHPEVTVVSSSAGRWAKAAIQGGRPVGIHFNSMLTLDDQHMDFVSAAVDSCLRVKLTKMERKAS